MREITTLFLLAILGSCTTLQNPTSEQQEKIKKIDSIANSEKNNRAIDFREELDDH